MSESIGLWTCSVLRLSESGEIEVEGLISADEDGLAKLALKLDGEVCGCVEMMSGAIWVNDQLELAGWWMTVAHVRKVRDIAPLACKTDKVDARVLTELCRMQATKSSRLTGVQSSSRPGPAGPPTTRAAGNASSSPAGSHEMVIWSRAPRAEKRR